MRLTIDLAFEGRPPHQFCLSGVERQNLGTLSHCLVLQFGYFSEMIVGGEICLWGRAEWPILSLQLNVGCTVLTVADFPILRQAHESLVVFTAEGRFAREVFAAVIEALEWHVIELERTSRFGAGDTA